MKNLFFTLILLLLSLGGCTQSVTSSNLPSNLRQTQWHKAKVAYLGDSITDKRRIGTKKVYWEYLEDYLGIQSYVFAKGGHTWKDIMVQAQELKDLGIDDLSAIIIFAGTNDYNSNTEMGTLYTESLQLTNHNGQQVQRKYRESSYDKNTFYGRINSVLSFLKQHFPQQQIILLTPIHRGYAHFNEKNVQPDERYANGVGFYIDDYVEAIKKAGQYWSLPIIDLFGTSGLSPLVDSHAMYFANKQKDLLHPNTDGHSRMAQTIMYQLLQFPGKF